ncbi:MAG: ATP-grasp domain-containing protein [Clostridia bacterium]|nr:ATP-grasp domain-containing protein [Clostridia bacterium]
MNYENIHVLLADGGDRQTLPLLEELKKLGCIVTTLNKSNLDVGKTSKYPDFKEFYIHQGEGVDSQIAAIEELAKSKKYDIVITTSDDVAEALSIKKSELEQYTKIAIVEPELFFKAYDKLQTMDICMRNDIPCPKTFHNLSNVEHMDWENITFPIVIKPRKSYGSIGFHRFDDMASAKGFCKSIGENVKEFVIQEYIPQTDIQYECAMFMDENSEVKTAMVFSKNRWFPVDGGSSTCNVSVSRPDIVETCTKLLKTIGWKGPADIDLIQDPRDNVAKVIEINPRVSGSVKIVIKSGINIVEQIVQLAMGEEVTPYIEYDKGVRLRCMHTELLWFIKSKKRFRTDPPFFDFRSTYDQIWNWHDPVPFFSFSLQALGKYGKEIKKRKR